MIGKFTLFVIIFFWPFTLILAQRVAPNHATVYSDLIPGLYRIQIAHTKKFTLATSLDSLSGNDLFYHTEDGPKSVSLEILKSVQIGTKKRPVLKSAILAGLGGGFLGGIIGFATYKDPGLPPSLQPIGVLLGADPSFHAVAGAGIGFLVGSIAGVVLGLSSRVYQVYDFSKLSLPERRVKMNQVLQEIEYYGTNLRR